jgi:1,4-alpha-glucan branching enzyme
MFRATKIRNSNAYQLTFSLPSSAPGQVSVVGDFNDWTPGRHRMRTLRDGSRAVSIRVSGGRPVRFRYLAPGGQWFDDEHADRDGGNCVVHL